jgi:hypothetical protein
LDFTIALFLIQDGIINGAIYALLAVALVLVFAVTRVILIPQGEFVTFAGLSLAAMETGSVPGAVWLLLVLAAMSKAAPPRPCGLPPGTSRRLSPSPRRCLSWCRFNSGSPSTSCCARP